MMTTISSFASESRFLTDPFIQIPDKGTISIVWFTEFEGEDHWVEWGRSLANRSEASSRLMPRIRKEIIQDNQISCPNAGVWRHEAQIKGLKEGETHSYQVISVASPDKTLQSKTYIFSTSPPPDKPLRILLTSDHQRKPMVPANMEKAFETAGPFDAIFFAGDLVEVADGYEDWFNDTRAFFPSLQGYAKTVMNEREYVGAALIQQTPLFPAIGNHEVMGRYSSDKLLKSQFQDPYPRELALQLQPNAEEKWLKDHSFNTDTYEEVFSLPKNPNGHSRYYSTTFGDIHLVVLYATRIWRSDSTDPTTKGKYQEAIQHLEHPEEWGYGDFIFEGLEKGSDQYNWLVKELESEPFKQAKTRIVMLHNPLHTLGENAIPPFSNPIQSIEKDSSGKITAIHYVYPKKDDILIRDIEPLLEKAEVDLVFYGHSHLWNRFRSPSGMDYLETSNVGNSYGAYTNPVGVHRGLCGNEPLSACSEVGDPNGLEPIVPSLLPLKDEKGNTLPYIASNDLTVFSVLNTSTRTIDSYYFDTRYPERRVVKFDSFKLREHPKPTNEMLNKFN